MWLTFFPFLRNINLMISEYLGIGIDRKCTRMTTSMALNVGTYLSQKKKKKKIVGTYYDAVKAIFRPSYVGLSQPY